MVIIYSLTTTSYVLPTLTRYIPKVLASAVSGHNKREDAPRWAPGDADITLSNATYNYWTANDQNATNPATISLPLINTLELTAKTQIMVAAGYRNYTDGPISGPGTTASYWLNTPANSTTGYKFYTNNAYMYSVNVGGAYAEGLSIRCVRP